MSGAAAATNATTHHHERRGDAASGGDDERALVHHQHHHQWNRVLVVNYCMVARLSSVAYRAHAPIKKKDQNASRGAR